MTNYELIQELSNGEAEYDIELTYYVNGEKRAASIDKITANRGFKTMDIKTDISIDYEEVES